MGLSMLLYVVLRRLRPGRGHADAPRHDAEKDVMIASIGPFWDANETWLVLGVGILLVAFPKAHGLVLGALYLPVALMLVGLILRGVAFDFRVKARPRASRCGTGWARAVILPMGVALVGISLATPLISPTVFDKWFSMPEFIGLLPIPVACAVAFYAAFHVISKPKVVAAGYGWVVFACTVLLFVLAFLGLAYSIYPYIVIDKLTVWQAASAHESLVVIFVGTAITLPVIVVYTIFMYRVFWGRASVLSYMAPVRHSREGGNP
jgi:cytochrome bd-type quinol oxidase subunit 2